MSCHSSTLELSMKYAVCRKGVRCTDMKHSCGAAACAATQAAESAPPSGRVVRFCMLVMYFIHEPNGVGG